jgi:hypothetical protein
MSRRAAARRACALLGVWWLGPPFASPASGACVEVAPVACERCFAVFVMPDTQSYARRSFQPRGAAHLDLVTRYVCQHRERWLEPSTGKAMPILMVIQLGDLVDDRNPPGDTGAQLAEWVRVDAAFDRLDACDPPVPYLVTTGNHDVAGGDYQGTSEGYDAYFGVERWARQGVQCADPADCDWQAGEYFIGGGDPIAARSRNRSGPGQAGPLRTQPGRHRAGVVRVPGGERLLFLGLEHAFDLPPAAPGREGLEGDDARWPRWVLDTYSGVPTIVFHHSLFWTYGPGDPRVRFGPEVWGSDSLTEGVPGDDSTAGMRGLWDRLIAPHRQIFMVFSGHVLKPATQADFTIERVEGPPVHGFLRNFQNAGIPGIEDPAHHYGAGWNVVAAFDPEAGEVRVRSYRIDDAVDAQPVAHRQRGEPAPTECLDMDWNGVTERVVKWSSRGADGAMRAP